ncbi:hypothetical protein BJ912DRAFT_904907 [Pholiota molesta]|nr:hypothetical protein BJ912DRAFT_904907 [Pholiota molesta]
MSPTDAMEYDPLSISNPSSRAAFPLRTISPLPPSLLHSSLMVSPDEEQTIRETIHDINTTLTSVDDEITRVRATLSTLEEYRSTLQTTLAQHQVALSPTRTLPPEILGEIFLFVLSDATLEWPGISGVSGDDMPWVLCKICKYWRAVAISVPGLWSNIRLNFQNSTRIEGSQHLLDLCLSRSKNELLTLSLHAKDLPTLLPIWNTLLTLSERWKDISLNGNLFTKSQNYLSLAKNRVPNLRRLCIETKRFEDWGNLPPSWPLEAFEHAENLRELYMTHIVYPLQNVRVPWSQITHFTSKGILFRESEFTEIMQHMTNLIAFSTDSDLSDRYIIDDSGSEPVLLPHLRKLSITNIGFFISAICRFLTVPNLEELSISAVKLPFLAERVLEMIKRSRCQPKCLTLRSSLVLEEDVAGIENSNVFSVLSALPSVTRLELTVISANLSILPALASHGPTTERAPLLPNLVSLVLEDRWCTSAFEIANALTSRVINNPHPGSLSISFRLLPPAAPKSYELDLLKGLAEKCGMEITILSN